MDALDDDETWFLGDADTEPQQRFLAVLRARAASWDTLDVRRIDTQAWPDNNPFCVHVDLVDEAYNQVYGTLRIDYDGTRVLGGWSDGQLVHEIDLAAPDAFASPPLASPEEAAEIAGGRLETQLCRPVERREWRRLWWLNHVSWVLADTDYPLCSASLGLPASDPRGAWHQGRSAPTGRLTIVQLRPARTIPTG